MANVYAYLHAQMNQVVIPSPCPHFYLVEAHFVIFDLDGFKYIIVAVWSLF